MRSTQTCPKCSGQRFAVNDEFRQPDQDSSDGTEPLPAITIKVPKDDWNPDGPSCRKALGSFETWICLGCGYTEFYAMGLDNIEAAAKQHLDRLRIVDAGTKHQGYR
jgi:predicted nucleic-acid-binding Zn-ribbon protein